MILLLRVNLDNAAFEDADEIPQILDRAERALRWWSHDFDGEEREPVSLRDSNGNTVGTVAIVESDPLEVLEAHVRDHCECGEVHV